MKLLGIDFGHVVRGGRARVNKAAVAPSKVSGHTILVFDFGTRWIGVAVGDTETRLSNPLGCSRRKWQPCMAEVETLVREWRPKSGGRPAARDGRHRARHDAARPALSRGGWEGRFRLPVALADERLSR